MRKSCSIGAALLTIVVLSAGLAGGCNKGVSAASVKPGMSAEQVRASLGNPLITGTLHNSLGAQPLVQERWTYRAGDDGLVVLMENDRVKSVATERNPIPAMTAKVKVGMSRAQVRAALGVAALGDNPRDPNPNPTWQYMDTIAPVETLTIAFEGDKVKSVNAMRNMAYP